MPKRILTLLWDFNVGEPIPGKYSLVALAMEQMTVGVCSLMMTIDDAIYILYMCVCGLEKLRKYFGAYGAVQDAVVMKDPISKRSRGFGFITFSDVDSVDNVLANEPHTIDMRRVRKPFLSSTFPPPF